MRVMVHVIGWSGMIMMLAGASCPIPGPIESIKPFDCDDPPDPSGEARATGIYAVDEPVPDRYIVIYDDATEGLVARVAQDASRWGAFNAEPLPIINGFRAAMTKRDARALAKDPSAGVTVFQDGVKRAIGELRVVEIDAEARLSWGQDRIDDREPIYDRTYQPRNRGAGIVIGVLDTGIDDESQDFANRLVYCDSVHIDAYMCRDDHGHGTHVAGTAAGVTWGVAPEALIASVRVLVNGQGADSDVINGVGMIVDWWQQNEHPDKPLVVNMSLGGGASWPLDYAICRAIGRGAHFALAAGNVDNSACHSSPARVWQANTIGATDRQDARTYFSANDGDTEVNPDTGRPWCEGIIDGFEPGWQIESTRRGCTVLPCNGVEMSGTSMASPHAAGVLAIILSEEGQMSPELLSQRYRETALPVVTDARSKHAILGYAGELN